MFLDVSTLSNLWAALGTAVLDFLLQGTLVGLVTWLVLACLHRSAAATRHAVASAALLTCLASFAASLVTALGRSASAGELAAWNASGLELPLAERALVADSGLTASSIAAWCWALGALFMALRFVLQCQAAHHLRTRSISTPPESLLASFRELLDELGVRRTVRLLESGLAEVPMVVGWLKPVVLVPAAALTALPPEQLRALLAHELTHVRRYDHLWNALQAIAEIVLFFHPVVWWISKQMRVEREFCCDDSSVRVTGDPKLLAEALASMETLRFLGPKSNALASHGGHLMQRITRILGVDGRSNATGWQLPAGLLLAGVVAFAGNAYASDAVVDPTPQSAEQKQADEKDNLEGIKKRIDAAISAGKITQEQGQARLEGAKKALDQRKRKAIEIEQKLADEQAEIAAAVKSGKLTAKEGEARIAAYQKWLREETRRGGSERYEGAARELEAMVKAGKISQADADLRLAHFRIQLGRKNVEQELRDLSVAIDRVRSGVASGKISREAAARKLKELEQALAEKSKKASELANHSSLVQSRKRIKNALAKGELTTEQAAKKLQQLEQRHDQAAVWAERFTSANKQELLPGVPVRRDRYAQFEADLKDRVASGELTKEQADERLAVMRREMDARRRAEEVRQRDVERLRYEEAAAKIEKAVAAGALSREQANAKLGEIRRAIQEEAREKDRLDALRARFQKKKAELTRAVAAGKLTEKQAKDQLIALENELGLKKRSEAKWGERKTLTEAELRDVREKLQRQVVEGKLTRKEMLQKLEDLEKRLPGAKDKAKSKVKDKKKSKSKVRRGGDGR